MFITDLHNKVQADGERSNKALVPNDLFFQPPCATRIKSSIFSPKRHICIPAATTHATMKITKKPQRLRKKGRRNDRCTERSIDEHVPSAKS